MNLTWLDWLLMLVYFTFVIGVGFALKKKTTTSAAFFQAGRAIPAWVCGLAFISANLGAQEIIGMAASGAKCGISTSHFYWVGAIPTMVFLGVFMMPFYYGSRARSVPEYLRLRFDEKTRAFNAISFASGDGRLERRVLLMARTRCGWVGIAAPARRPPRACGREHATQKPPRGIA